MRRLKREELQVVFAIRRRRLVRRRQIRRRTPSSPSSSSYPPTSDDQPNEPIITRAKSSPQKPSPVILTSDGTRGARRLRVVLALQLHVLLVDLFDDFGEEFAYFRETPTEQSVEANSEIDESDDGAGDGRVVEAPVTPHRWRWTQKDWQEEAEEGQFFAHE